jgi:RNA polymerase sigma factor (sigma-70 family)
VTKDQTQGTGPEEVERRDYAALVDSLADTLDLRSGLSEAVNTVDYTAMSDHIAGFLDLEAGLQSVLAVSTGADAEPPLRATTEKAADSVADPPLPIGDWDAAAWDEIFHRPPRLVSAAVRSFRQQEAGPQSVLAGSTRADAEPPLQASTEKAADSVSDLLLRIRKGDAAAWDEILRRYGKLVSATVRSFRLQEADALDAVQMTWLRLAENAHRVQFPERLNGWLATMARRECLHILHQAKRLPALIDVDVIPDTVANPSVDPEHRVVDADTERILRELVAELSPRRRTLVAMLFADNPLPYAEVARAAGIPPGGIGPTRARALRQLRDKLHEYELGPGGVAKDAEGEPTG